jgi:LacI family transcriptional regulator
MVTIRDVAKASGFSSSTVSIVLNDAPLARYIPPTTKTRIQQAAKKLGYRPNLFARSLRGKRNREVGVMVFDITDPYCTPILRGIQNALYEGSYLPILTDAQNERARFLRYLEMLLDRRVDGLIILANWLFVDINLLEYLERNGVPTAMISRELKSDSISSVILDNEAGGRMAMEHLVSLGHKKIAIFRGPKLLGDSAPRWRGMKKVAQAAGVSLDEKLMVDLPDSRNPLSSFEAGLQLTEELLRQRKAFTALIAFDDLTAFGAIRALEKNGLRVPADCSIIGFDDIDQSAFYNPALTTIRQPMQGMGAAAVSVLLEAITVAQDNRRLTAVHQRMMPELIVRDSTRAIR